MPGNHAVLSASASHRWMACPPSALLCAEIKDTESEFAKQGTDAHALCEYKVRKYLGEESRDPSAELEYFDEEMSDCTDSYSQYVAEQIQKAKDLCKDPIVLVEQKLDFSKYVPEGFGTGDCVIVADNTLAVIDLMKKPLLMQ